MTDNSTPSQAQADWPWSLCPASPTASTAPNAQTGHQWESLSGAAGWFGCAVCGVVGICFGCLPTAVHYPASWGIPMRCEQHAISSEEPGASDSSVLWCQVNGVPTLEVLEAPAGAVPYQRMTPDELARLRKVQQQWRMPPTRKRGDA